MGPSGAGKSTLLNCLAGRLTTGVTGDISVNGSKVDPVKFRRNIAYVMQEVSEATRCGCWLLAVGCYLLLLAVAAVGCFRLATIQLQRLYPQHHNTTSIPSVYPPELTASLELTYPSTHYMPVSPPPPHRTRSSPRPPCGRHSRSRRVCGSPRARRRRSAIRSWTT